MIEARLVRAHSERGFGDISIFKNPTANQREDVRIITCGGDSKITIRNLKSLDHADVVISGGESTTLTGLAVSPSGTQFCVADEDHFVKVCVSFEFWNNVLSFFSDRMYEKEGSTSLLAHSCSTTRPTGATTSCAVVFSSTRRAGEWRWSFDSIYSATTMLDF